MIQVTQGEDVVLFAVCVAPRASRDAIDGEWQGALKIRLTAPPVGGRANKALRKFLAGRLKIPLSAVRIVSGEKSRKKRVAANGVSAEQIRGLVQRDAEAARFEKRSSSI